MNQPLSIEQQIEKALEAKYLEKFKVIESNFEIGLNLYTFKAHPKNEKDLVFNGQFDERASTFEKQAGHHDSYPNEAFAYAAEKSFKAILNPRFNPFTSDVSIYSYYNHTFGNQIISFEDFLKNRPEKSTIRFNMYLFEIPSSSKDKMLTDLKEILEKLQAEYHNKFSLYLGIWPKGFLEGKTFEELTFGFQSTKMSDEDNLLNVVQYMDKLMFIKIVNGSVESLTEERIFELIKDTNTKGPNLMIEI